jgi:sortase A
MGIWRRATTRTDGGPPAAPRARRHGLALRVLERLLLVFGIVCLGYYGFVSAETALYQAWEARELDAILEGVAQPGVAPASAASATRPAPARGDTVARIEIPRLGVSAVVRAGVDARTLRLAVGHIPGTALPGDHGNVGLAAHRDTFFRRLADIRSGDRVQLVTPGGTFVYRVDGTTVVDPSDVWVLDPTEHPALTLVTCYPFTYIGAAPQRYIVRATLDRG